MRKRKKIKVGLIFGGRSGEHEVSLQSAKSIYEALDKKKYDVLLIGIDKQGKWRLGNSSNYLLHASNPKLIALNKSAPEVTALAKTGETALISPENGETLSTAEVMFPIIHGTYGEDGSLQGLLELLNTAYVGAGVLGSAVGMDKDVMKRLLRDAGIPIAEFVTFTKGTLTPEALRSGIKKLGFPIFVKPANMGSSVGITKAHDEEELLRGIADAFRYDTKILLEKFVPGREIEVAILGNEKPRASLPGEIMPTHEFYSYEAKYIDESGARTAIPAKMPAKKIKEVQELAVKAFRVLDCAGMGRIDFFYTAGGKFILNEINTLPGFTKISMYPKLWEASGIPYSKLLDLLIELALERKAKKDRLKRTFET